ncbi:hypothetical protein PybrP1_007121 [[Pythium] brassicae (nom. inval.)]|nr:hypothetical protein PybrP1_007121 [[Pythium] brassicae (nom. inval.)]
MDSNAAHVQTDLGEWALVDDQAEVVASVSTSTERSSGCAPAEESASEEPTVAAAPVAQSAEGAAECEAEVAALSTAAAAADLPTEAAPAVPDGCLRIVDDFVAEFFADAVAEGKKVRLIYMGMLLIHDRAMGEYGIEDDGVLHCASQQHLNLKGLANPANALLVATGAGLYSLWALLYHFPHLFSWKAIAVLSALSAAHVSTAVARFTAA